MSCGFTTYFRKKFQVHDCGERRYDAQLALPIQRPPVQFHLPYHLVMVADTGAGLDAEMLTWRLDVRISQEIRASVALYVLWQVNCK